MIREEDDPFYGYVDYYTPQKIRGFKNDPIRSIHMLLGAIKDHISRIARIIRANRSIQNAEDDLLKIVKYYQAYCAILLGGIYRGYDQLFFGTVDLLNPESAADMMSQNRLWQDIPNMIRTINRQPLKNFIIGSGRDALMELINFYQCILSRRMGGLD